MLNVVYLYLTKVTGNKIIGELRKLWTTLASLTCLLFSHTHDVGLLSRLSVDLFTHSALVEWAQGNTEEMAKSIDEVFNNANCFEDTLRAAHVKLVYLRMTGNCLSEAFAYGFQILEHLGETFPATPENGIIVQELLGMRQSLASVNTSELTDLPQMTDSTKNEAMRFLEEMLICSYQNQSLYFPLIACRMVHITLQYGLSNYSCVGENFSS